MKKTNKNNCRIVSELVKLDHCIEGEHLICGIRPNVDPNYFACEEQEEDNTQYAVVHDFFMKHEDQKEFIIDGLSLDELASLHKALGNLLRRWGPL